MNNCILKQHSLIVSCQALEDEPLHGSEIMAKMAKAAYDGGASGIRANSLSDIRAIKKEVDLPVIGIVKRVYDGSEVYITPTMKEVDEVAESGAIDATARCRPEGCDLGAFIQDIRTKHPNLRIMADISTLEEGIHASHLGVDIISTTLCGYTEETKDVEIPNFRLVRQLAKRVAQPVICEGGIQTPEQLLKALKHGAYACVVGSAITRPQLITRKFTDVIANG
jgi:N-acylglucosamine-6-phosphate 2-epimerase